jgi:hypothetical protein
LRHIWGDGGGILGGSSCNADDGVEDTPNQGLASNYNCDDTQNSCPEEPDMDMIENYMDYSSQDCQNTFTYGQVAIMRAVLEGPRAELLSGSSSTSSSIDSFELRIFPNPADQILNINFTKNGLKNAPSTIEILDLNGRNVLIQPISNTSGESLNIDITSLPSGMYLLKYGTVIHKVFKI